jgi:hypothetical protein
VKIKKKQTKMNNLKFSLILIVIYLCDYISTVPYGSLNKGNNLRKKSGLGNLKLKTISCY